MDINFSFNRQAYIEILQSALDSGYKFFFFHDNRGLNDKVCLLRHDIDADMHAALEMAKIEHSLGIKSTYFLMTRSAVYNLFSRINMEIAKSIMKLGHEIGLHFDEGYYPHNKISLQEFIDVDASFLEHQFNQKIKVVSFHQPGERILKEKYELTNYINTYDNVKLEGFYYLSDSNRIWKNEHPVQLFNSRENINIQLLIHPMWWICDTKDTSTNTVWDLTLLRNLKNVQHFLHNTERAYQNPGEFYIRAKH